MYFLLNFDLPTILASEETAIIIINMPQQLRCKCGIARHKCGVVQNDAAWRGERQSADMSRLLQRCVAYLHTPQICGTCRGVKVRIYGLLNWTAKNLYLGKAKT
jgi:hypothetical protein